MRAVCLVLALILIGPPALAADPTFIERLAARGPQELRVAEGLGPVLPDGRAWVSVEDGVLLITIQRAGGGPTRTFRYDGKRFDDKDLYSDPHPAFDLEAYCKGDGAADRFEIQCFSRLAMRSAAMRPPSSVWTLWLAEDGVRVVVQGGLGGRTTLTPLNPVPRGASWLAPGVPANLGYALSQLAAHDNGYMYGGASGGGEWYGSSLWLREVSGLDFKLERTVHPDRGGRSDQVPATWSFDYQGRDKTDPDALAWRMYRDRKGVTQADFWCLGRTAGTVVTIACHRGGKPSDARGRPDVTFRLEPFPEWRIYVDPGPDNAFSSVGSVRFEPLPFP
ncbi:MAG: hypothetical protein Q7T61_01365 [Caulobacter sp.]|nr:hypothetical protein [Caulobacter sp.]